MKQRKVRCQSASKAYSRYLSDGFKGQIRHSCPSSLLQKAKHDPLAMDFYPTDIGWFPRAVNHYRERAFGAEEHILIYCTTGSGWFEINGRVHEVTRDQILLIPRRQAHRYAAAKENPWSIYWAHITGRTAAIYAGYFAGHHDIISLKPIVSTRIKAIFTECCKNLEQTVGFGFTLLVAHALRHVMGLALFSNQKIPSIGNPSTGLDLGKTLAFMKENVNKTLTLKEIAQDAGYSVSRFASIFKSQTGVSPVDYFIDLRMQAASIALMTTNLSIKQIAEQLGYPDPYYFSRLFSRTMGMSPSMYRDTPKG